ncbi:hypothetical protein ABIA27_001174 [Sinorhizobium fredii]
MLLPPSDQGLQRFRRSRGFDLRDAATFAADLNARRLCQPFRRELLGCRGLIRSDFRTGPISATGNNVMPDPPGDLCPDQALCGRCKSAAGEYRAGGQSRRRQSHSSQSPPESEACPRPSRHRGVRRPSDPPHKFTLGYVVNYGIRDVTSDAYDAVRFSRCCTTLDLTFKVGHSGPCPERPQFPCSLICGGVAWILHAAWGSLT